MKNPEVTLKINQTYDIFEDDKVQTELRNWIAFSIKCVVTKLKEFK